MKKARIVYVLIGVAALTSVARCKKKPSANQIKEFENSSDICGDIDQYAKEKYQNDKSRNMVDIFAAKRASEKQILEMLINEYQGRVISIENAERSQKNPSNPPADKKDGTVISGDANGSTMKNIVPPSSGNNTASGATKSTNLTNQNTSSLNSPQPSNGGTNDGENTFVDGRMQMINKQSIQSISSICSEYTNASGSNFQGIPPMASSVYNAAEAKSIVKRYCTQLTKLNSSTCKSSSSETVLCSDIAKGRPQWVNDSCEVTTKFVFTSLDAAALQTCSYIGDAAKVNGACGAEIIAGVCLAHESGLKIALDKLNDVDVTDAATKESLATATLTAFTSSAIICLQGVAKESLKKSLLAGGKPGFFSAAYAGGQAEVDKLLKGGIETAQKSGVIGKIIDAAPNIAAAVCSASATAIANTISQVPPTEYKSACGPRTESESQAKVGSCFRTVASLCDAYTGSVDFNAIVGETPGGAKVALSAVSTAASIGCGMGGKTSEVACGLISSASQQIKKAILTGNNDWADCVGTAKMGACIGEKLGSKGWTNDSPIATPKTDNRGQTTKRCCRCDRVFYKSVFGSDLVMGESQTIGVIQEGDFASGSCNRPGGKPQNSIFWESDDRYYIYDNCGPVTVSGEKCMDSAQIVKNTQYRNGTIIGP